jgi:dTDP-4-dehydrorhamnose reductase
MKVCIIGADGQFGKDLVRAFSRHGHQVSELTHAGIEVSDAVSADSVLGAAKPDVVVNTAAFHNVEACESEPEKAFGVNAFGARNLAMAAEKHAFKLIHVSTDYVFDGEKGQPYTEQDCPRPVNCYGNSKLSGELFIRATCRNHVIVRVSGLYGTSPCLGKKGLNFVKLMLKLARERGEVKVVTDEHITPTYTLAAAEQIVKLSFADRTGLFHATPQGQCSWYEFAEAIFQFTGTTVKLRPATSADFPSKVPRPHYSVLDNKMLRDCSLDIMPEWKDSLRQYLAETGELKAA